MASIIGTIGPTANSVLWRRLAFIEVAPYSPIMLSMPIQGPSSRAFHLYATTLTPLGWILVGLSQDCTESEREAQAVSAADLLKALARHRSVELERVVIIGDVAFDALP